MKARYLGRFCCVSRREICVYDSLIQLRGGGRLGVTMHALALALVLWRPTIPQGSSSHSSLTLNK